MTTLAVPPLSDSAQTMNSHTQAAGRSRVRVLLGFFQPKDTAAYLTTINAVAESDTGALDRQCLDARAHVAQLGVRGEPIATPMAEHPHWALLRAEPTFAEHISTPEAGPQLAIIELRNLIACQPRVDWDHVERLAEQVPPIGDEEGLLRFCVPLQRDAIAPRAQITFNPVTNTFGWMVDNPDVRICGPVQGEQAGTGRALVGFSLGPGLHQMSVVSFNGRHMLNNGYHRAVALARAGHEKIPVLVVKAPTLELTPAVRNGMFNPNLVFGSIPPRIMDFLGPAAVDVSTKKVRFLFSVHAEQHPILG